MHGGQEGTPIDLNVTPYLRHVPRDRFTVAAQLRKQGRHDRAAILETYEPQTREKKSEA